MVNYTTVRACGHEADVKARGATPTRERKLDRERQRICRRCALENQRSEAEVAAEAGELPALVGDAQTDSLGNNTPSQGSGGRGDAPGLSP